MYRTRPYALEDRAACLALFDSNTPTYFLLEERAAFEGFLDDLASPYLVIEREGRVVACGGHALEADDRTASLCWGMVDRTLHGQGVGRALTEARIAAALGDPAAVAVLRLETSHLTAGFYERFGFRTVERREDALGPGLHACEMRLEL